MENIKNDNYSKIILFSVIGIIVFFVPIKINNQYETVLNYIAYFIDNKISPIIDISIIFFIVLSILKDLINKEDRKFTKSKIIIKIISFILCVSVLMGREDIFFLDDEFLVTLRDLMLDLTILLPVSSVFLPLLLDFGLTEIVEAYTNKLMKKVFKVSGKIFLNFLVYFLVNNVCGAFVTYKLYKDGKLREKEAVITILNFSILSLSLTKDLTYKIHISTISFILIEIIVLCICNFVICRIYPINKKKQSYYFKSGHRNVNCKKHKINKAIQIYNVNKSNKNIVTISLAYLNDSLEIIINVMPMIIFIFFIGNIIYKIPFIINAINNSLNFIINKFNIPNSILLSNIVSINVFNNILAIKNMSKNMEYISKIIVSLFISLQPISISFLIPFIKKSIIEIKISEIIIIIIERFFIILSISCVIYNFYLRYII